MDSQFLDRIRQILLSKAVEWEEKKMFGGRCFMVNGKMLLGTYKGSLMARTDPDEKDDLILKDGVAPMIHGGREMKGFLNIEPLALETDRDLEFWIDKCLEYNPKAKSSKKK